MPSPFELRRHTLTSIVATGLLSLLTLPACGASDSTDASSAVGEAGSGTLQVAASFYPLAYLATQIGADHVTVTTLTKPGGEPHDLELTPGDVAEVSEVDLVVYLAGFQPSVDDAVTQAEPDHVFDAAASADLARTFTPIEDGEEHDDEAGSIDPHFWLDPVRYAAVAGALGTAFGEIDPDNAQEYAANATAFADRLDALDGEFSSALAACTQKNLVTSHNAFGYLAERYGFEQLGITGLTPEDDPSASSLAVVSDFVRDNDVATIYFETLVDPSVAEAVAAETGAATAVLDPLEGLTDDSAGDDYFEVMRSNLATLSSGQSCG